ncbi:MAG: hypothetical protein KU37_07735 [Sulfuricurvum sp. PC08-66]|nr:MAG: hypothetical protein KU37_07735 [Sulfuricurvum sp. PC08-66]
MKRTLFVSATNTGIGKSFAALELVRYYGEMGYKVGVLKPIETGVVDVPCDAALLLETARQYNTKLLDFGIEDVCPYAFKLPAAPYVARGHTMIEIEILLMALQKMQEVSEIVIIEGAGGLLVPIDEKLFMIDIAHLFADKVLLVVPSTLGSINDTLLSRTLLEAHDLPYVWAVNCYASCEEFAKITAPYYEANGGYLTLQKELPTIAQRLLES